MARYRESGVPRPQRWMALVGAGCAHGSPSLVEAHGRTRERTETAPGVSNNNKTTHTYTTLRTTHCMGSITAREAHVTGQNTPLVGVCVCVCVYGVSL